jgi:hypothetical protein
MNLPTQQQLDAALGSLYNDENSSDAELMAHFVGELELPEVDALELIARRPAILRGED